MNLGVLASHEGTTLQALLDACSDGRIQGRVAVVVSNNGDSGALRRARAAGVAAVHLSAKTHADPAALDAAIRGALVTAGVDVVFLAGYMKKLGPLVLEAFEGRILNTHPALLPSFKGWHAVRDALSYGVKVTGCTVHVATLEVDHGPILAQRAVDVLPGDTEETLHERIKEVERALYVHTIRQIVERGSVL